MQIEKAKKPTNFQNFNEKWVKKYPWLYCVWEYDEQDNQWRETMYCEYCVKYN